MLPIWTSLNCNHNIENHNHCFLTKQVRVNSEAEINNAVSQTKRTKNVHYFIFYNLHKFQSFLQSVTICTGCHTLHGVTLWSLSYSLFGHTLHLIIHWLWSSSPFGQTLFGHTLHLVKLCICLHSVFGHILNLVILWTLNRRIEWFCHFLYAFNKRIK